MSKNLVWDYFTQHRRPVAECNLCNEWYYSEQVLNLEKHLTREHPVVITEIRENIRRAELTEYFEFDVGDSEARCIIDNCIVNIFNGIDMLRTHLSNHNILPVYRKFSKYTKTFRMAQRNTNGTISRPKTVEDNASANNQLTDAYLQDTEEHKGLFWGSSNHLVWRYFKPNEKPYAKCDLCGKNRNGQRLADLVKHLLYCHTKEVLKIRKETEEEIRRFNLSSYFVCDPKLPRVKCKVNNCFLNVSIFLGIKGLRNHLRKYHAMNISTSQNMSRSNEHMMTESIAEGSNTNTNIDDPV